MDRLRRHTHMRNGLASTWAGGPPNHHGKLELLAPAHGGAAAVSGLEREDAGAGDRTLVTHRHALLIDPFGHHHSVGCSERTDSGRCEEDGALPGTPAALEADRHGILHPAVVVTHVGKDAPGGRHVGFHVDGQFDSTHGPQGNATWVVGGNTTAGGHT